MGSKSLLIKHTAEREKDVQELCKAVLQIDPQYVGDHEAVCPFCYVSEYISLPPWPKMVDLGHERDCAYLIAKDLLTRVEKERP